MFDVSMFVTEPTRWQYQLPSSWEDLPELFRYFGCSDIRIMIDAEFTSLILDGKTFLVENSRFGNTFLIAKEVVGMLNHLHFKCSECVYFYHGDDTIIEIEKTTMQVFLSEKPALPSIGEWDIFIKSPIDLDAGIGDLPECQLLF
jgi:hypothetical protein